MARQVEVVEALMAAARGAGDKDEVSYLRTKEVALRSKEAALREETLLFLLAAPVRRVSPQSFRLCAPRSRR